MDLVNSRILPELPPITSSPPTKARREKPHGKEAASSLPHATNLTTTRNSLRKTAFPGPRQSASNASNSNSSLRSMRGKNKRQIFILQFSYKNYLDKRMSR